jgi:Icc-related predicted phosphoesterase
MGRPPPLNLLFRGGIRYGEDTGGVWMRLVLTSDLHGQLPDIPACDALLIAGDLCPVDNYRLDHQEYWLRYHFIPWLRNVPARQKIFIAGNHDFLFAQRPDLIREMPWPGVYLQDSGVVWEGVSFWGSPWANELVGWPFTAPENELYRIWDDIPVSTQVLLVHGPPHGYGDTVIGSVSGDPLHVGSHTLNDRFYRLPNLRLVVFGHIHEGAGIYPHPSGISLYNASLMNVHYYPVNPPRVVELDLP